MGSGRQILWRSARLGVVCGLLAFLAPADLAPREARVTILAVRVGPPTLSATAEVPGACDPAGDDDEKEGRQGKRKGRRGHKANRGKQGKRNDEEQCFLRWAFQIRSGTTTVRTLAGETPVPGAEEDARLTVSFSASFDDRDAAGRLLPDGAYHVVLTVRYVEVEEGDAELLGSAQSAPVPFLLDVTAPTITATVTPPANTQGWHKADVTVTFTCQDAASGIATCPAPVVVSTEEVNQTISGTATDRAGNSATATTVVNLDKTAPTIQATVSPAPNAHGWRTTDVTVTFTCQDATAGIATCPEPVVVGTEGANQPITGTATDRAGNSATATTVVNLDRTAPSLTITAPADGTTLDTPTPVVRLTYADLLGAGVDLTSLRVQINGVERKALFTAGETEATATLTPETALNEGGNTIQAEIQDRAGNPASASAQVTVITLLPLPPLPAGFGLVLGEVRDTATGQPLPGTTVKVLGTATTAPAVTDSAGRFRLPAPAGPRVPVHVGKGGYVDAKVFAVLEAGRESTVGTVRLQLFDPVATRIGPEGGAHRDRTGTVEVIFPAGAVPIAMDVTATVFPTAADFPLAMPPGTAYLGGVQFTPEGLTFPTPVTLRVPNTFGLPPGMAVPFAFANHSEEEPEVTFFDPGFGRVSADGTVIEFELAHFTCPVWGAGVRPSGRAPAITTEPDQPVRASPQKCCLSDPEVNAQAGSLAVEVPLPAVRTLGAAQPLTLTYDSGTADPEPVVEAETFSDPATTTRPDTVTWTLQVGGTAETRTFAGATGAARFAWSWDARDAAGRALPTGSYAARVTVRNDYPGTLATTDRFGGPPFTSLGIPAPAPAGGASSFAVGRVLIHNRQGSPFGAGWGLKGLQQLFFEPDGSLLLTEGRGTALLFRPQGTQDPAPVFIEGGCGLTGRLSDHVATDAQGNVYVSSQRTIPGFFFFFPGLICRITPAGAISTFFVGRDPQGFDHSFGALTVAPNGDLYVVQDSTMIVRIRGGQATTVATLPFASLSALAVDALGTIWAAHSIPGGGALFRISPDGSQVTTVLTTNLHAPSALALDLQGNVFLADAGNSRILRVSPLLEITEFATGLGELSGLATDAQGHLYATSSVVIQTPAGTPERLTRILRFTPAGTRSTYLQVPRVSFAGLARTPTGLQYTVYFDSTIGRRVVARIRPDQAFQAPPGEFSTLIRQDQGTADPTDDTFIRRLKDGTTIAFDPQGRQTATVDRQGNTTTFTYDAEGRLTQITDPVGQGTTFAYAAAGQLQAITDPAGRVTTVTLDGAGNLVALALPDGATRTFTYDAAHRLTTQTDPTGAVTAYAHDPQGRLAQVTQPTGATKTYLPSHAQGLINNLPPGTGTPAAPAPLLPLDPFAQVTDGLGHPTTLRTDRLGAATQIVDPLGRLTQTARDANSLPTRITRPNGSVVTLTYDARGNLLTSTEQAIGATTRFTYEPTFNQVTSITDPRGNRTTLTYDSQGNPTAITDALGHTTTMTYDPRGLLTRVTDALGHTTTFTYDARGNLLTTTDPLGHTTTPAYDAAGNVLSSTDALGRTTRFAYDPMNRLTSVTDATGGITRYTYDPKGTLTSVTDAKGQITTFTYDEVGQLVQTTNPLGQTKTFSYDLARNLTLVVDAKGQRSEFDYDAANQRVQKVLKNAAGAVTDTLTFAYDALGNLALAADSDSSLSFTYDAVGRISQAQTGATAGQAASAVMYTYDLAGNRVSMTDPEGGVTSYAYDPLSRLTSLTSPQGTATFTYDALSRRTALSLPNGTQASYAYDAASQLTRLLNQGPAASPVAISEFAYAYDAAGNRATRTTTNGIASYTYDALNRLTQAIQPDPIDPLRQLTEAFAYDPVGNRTASHLATGQVHDAANRLLEDSNFTFTYDANGNLSSKTAKATGARTIYTYNGENQLVRVDTFTVTGGTTPVLTARYRYDALGRRIAKEVTQGGATTTITRYLYDQEDIQLELDSANVVQARYTHGPGIDEPLIMEKSGASFFHHADGLGSITEITDASGVVKQRYTYSSFGKIESRLDPDFIQPYAFTSREFDPETGLYFYRARYYDSSTGRFLQQDPVPSSDTNVNLYPYVGNNPSNRVDPFGEFAIAIPALCAANAVACYAAGIAVSYAVCRAMGGCQLPLPGTIEIPSPVDICILAREPGVPTEKDGFKPKKNWDGKLVPNPNGPGHGYPDKDGNVWIPTGTGPSAHAGPHWDVQKPGGGYVNVYPGGKVRPGK